jgi:hypothetical protein
VKIYLLNLSVVTGVFRSMLLLLVTVDVALSSPNLVTLKICSSETAALTRRNNPEDGILHSNRRENLKSYIALTGLTL